MFFVHLNIYHTLLTGVPHTVSQFSCWHASPFFGAFYGKQGCWEVICTPPSPGVISQISLLIMLLVFLIPSFHPLECYCAHCYAVEVILTSETLDPSKKRHLALQPCQLERSEAVFHVWNDFCYRGHGPSECAEEILLSNKACIPHYFCLCNADNCEF